jgi:hypothetical protein
MTQRLLDSYRQSFHVCFYFFQSSIFITDIGKLKIDLLFFPVALQETISQI